MRCQVASLHPVSTPADRCETDHRKPIVEVRRSTDTPGQTVVLNGQPLGRPTSPVPYACRLDTSRRA
jgi:hypothetical protein